jgi:hypothetical protein
VLPSPRAQHSGVPNRAQVKISAGSRHHSEPATSTESRRRRVYPRLSSFVGEVHLMKKFPERERPYFPERASTLRDWQADVRSAERGCKVGEDSIQQQQDGGGIGSGERFRQFTDHVMQIDADDAAEQGG